MNFDVLSIFSCGVFLSPQAKDQKRTKTSAILAEMRVVHVFLSTRFLCPIARCAASTGSTSRRRDRQKNYETSFTSNKYGTYVCTGRFNAYLYSVIISLFPRVRIGIAL